MIVRNGSAWRFWGSGPHTPTWNFQIHLSFLDASPPQQSGPLVGYKLRSTRQTLKMRFILGQLILFLKVGLAKKWKKGGKPVPYFFSVERTGSELGWDVRLPSPPHLYLSFSFSLSLSLVLTSLPLSTPGKVKLVTWIRPSCTVRVTSLN